MDSSKFWLKNFITRMFRPSSLFRRFCTSTAATTRTSHATKASTTYLRMIQDDLFQEPALVLSPRRHCHHLGDDFLNIQNSLDRDLPSPSLSEHRQHTFHATLLSLLPSFRAKKTVGKKKEKGLQTGVLYKADKEEGYKCPPASPSFVPKSHHDTYYCDPSAKPVEKTGVKRKDKINNSKKKPIQNGFGLSTFSSLDNDGAVGSFTRVRDEDVKTIFSSRSFTSDTTEFYHIPSADTNNKKNVKEESSHDLPIRGDKKGPIASSSSRKRRDKVKKVVELEGSFAVEKWSTDPYEDFRSSMVEMISERRLFEAVDLERLLQPYLSLNSPRNHGVILKAFRDICGANFGN